MLYLNSGRDQLLLLPPKYLDPCLFLSFRPISVTPILSRLAEKLVVRNWLFPAIDSTVIADQFAFKPTGSTTCALTFFMHHVTRLHNLHFLNIDQLDAQKRKSYTCRSYSYSLKSFFKSLQLCNAFRLPWRCSSSVSLQWPEVAIDVACPILSRPVRCLVGSEQLTEAALCTSPL